MNLIALFAATIYNIYNICAAKNSFNGLYDNERSSGKMVNHSTQGVSVAHGLKYRALFGWRLLRKLKYEEKPNWKNKTIDVSLLILRSLR